MSETISPPHLQPTIKFVRKNLKEIVPSTDGNLTFSLLNILTAFFKPFEPKEVRLNSQSKWGGVGEGGEGVVCTNRD